MERPEETLGFIRIVMPNEIAGANAGLRTGFVEKLQVILSLLPGVARLKRRTGVRIVRHLRGVLACALLLPACKPNNQQADDATVLPKDAEVRVSFLNEATALDSTIAFLKNHGCSRDGLVAFEKAVSYYNFLPLEVERRKFPRAENGFYTFQSMNQLIAALPHKLCETPHPFQLNCYDTVIFLTDGQLKSGLGPDDIFGYTVAPRITTNWDLTLSTVATAGDAYWWSWPSWYQELIGGFIPPGSLKSRTNLLAALYSFYPLPGHTTEESVTHRVLETLRWNWRRQAITFPQNCDVVLCHEVRLDPPAMLTVHAGLLFAGNKVFTYIEKDGGFGPFVRLDFNARADLLKWLSQEHYCSSQIPLKGEHPRTFVTFNQDHIEELPLNN